MSDWNEIPLKLKINGEAKEVQVPVQATLLDVLRERLDLSGTKKGCDHGQCGACTVLLVLAPFWCTLTCVWCSEAP